MLLKALAMKCKFSKSCVFFSFISGFFLKIDDSLIFFLIQKMTVFLGGYSVPLLLLQYSRFVFHQFFWWFFRLNLKKCHSSNMITEFSGQRWSITMIKSIESTNGKFVFADVTWICNSFLFTLKICKVCKIISESLNLITYRNSNFIQWY